MNVACMFNMKCKKPASKSYNDNFSSNLINLGLDWEKHV